MQKGQYPNAFYRVSVKAIISDDSGNVFCVREGADWTLPGGGVDHGEELFTALKRELYEEACIEAAFTAELIGTESFYVRSKDAMAMWIVYKLKINDSHFTFHAGDDADEVAFKNPKDFQESNSLLEQLIFKYGSLKS